AFDGGLTPGSWKWNDPEAKAEGRPNKTMEAAHWVHLDGTYFIRDGGPAAYFDISTMAGLEHRIRADMERLEVRGETPGLADNGCTLLMALKSKNSATLSVILSSGQLQAFVSNPNPQGRQPNWRDIPLEEKLGNDNMRHAVRLFADTRTGTCD